MPGLGLNIVNTSSLINPIRKLKSVWGNSRILAYGHRNIQNPSPLKEPFSSESFLSNFFPCLSDRHQFIRPSSNQSLLSSPLKRMWFGSQNIGYNQPKLPKQWEEKPNPNWVGTEAYVSTQTCVSWCPVHLTEVTFRSSSHATHQKRKQMNWWDMNYTYDCISRWKHISYSH